MVSNIHPFIEYTTVTYMTYLKNILVFIVPYITFSFTLSKILPKREREASTKELKGMDVLCPQILNVF